MIVLHLESFENNLFELSFQYLKKRVSVNKHSQEDDFLHGYEMFFFRDSCSFPYIKTLMKVSGPVFEKKSDTSQQPKK